MELAEKQAQLRKEAELAVATLRGEYGVKEKEIGYNTVKLQMSGKDKEEESPITYTFHDMTKADIPRHLYSDMISWALSKGQIGEDYVDEDNVELVLRKHPEIVNSYLNVHGLGTKPEESPVVDEQIPNESTGLTEEQQAQIMQGLDPRIIGRWYRKNKKQEENTESNVNSDIEPSSDVKKKWASKKTE
jgi:hypothetical protein